MTFPRPYGVSSIEEAATAANDSHPGSTAAVTPESESAGVVLSAARRTVVYEVFLYDTVAGAPRSCGVFSSLDNARRYVEDQQGDDREYLITERSLDVVGEPRRICTP